MNNTAYMNKLVEWKSKHSKGIGVELAKIKELESKYNIAFPKAYKEFLKLSGIYCAVILYGSHRFEFSEENQTSAKRWLKEYKLESLIKKPFWVIATLSGVAFWYFHFDEGDNPPIYRLDCENYEEYPDEYSFGKVANSFQEWIEEAIERYEEDPDRNK